MTTDAPLAELTLVEAAMRCVWTRGPSTFLRAVASSRPSSSRDPPPPERVLTTRPTLLRARRVLHTPNPSDKAALTDEIAALWASGAIAEAYRPDEVHPDPPAKPARCDPIPSPRTPRRVSPRFPRACPEVPTLTLPPPRRRDDRVTLVEPSKAPRLGKGGSPESRIAILHSLAHIESWAIDLSWDIVARFGAARRMPRAFFDDFVAVAVDEARHFSLLSARLEALGSSYGALNAHDGLWNSATETAHSLEARLVIEHCVHEARGLDVLPSTIAKFRNGGDDKSADLLEHIIYPEEVTHCAAGVRWFTYLHERRDPDAGDAGVGTLDGGESSAGLLRRFHQTVWRHFRGVLKPPFNDEARARAGFGKEWYEPLCRRPEEETAAKGA